jgi:nascent polypeptide-associated complex subunit alpha
MFGGGGGFDPRKMEQMMQQMGIDMDELDAEEVVIRTADAEYVFDTPDVTKMDARGQATYTVVGDPEERERGAGGGAAPIESGDGDADGDDGGSGGIPDADVEMVQTRTGASEEEARAALEDNDGDLAAAVAELE